MNNTEKSRTGKIYNPMSDELKGLRAKAHDLCARYNSTRETEIDERLRIIDELLPEHGENCYMQGPIQFDYGCFTKVGKNFYANFNFTVLDTCDVTVGDNVFIGPNVSILTPLHPYIPEERNPYFDEGLGYVTDREYGKPISIGSDTWIAGNVTILPGVSIGSRCVIGAGSVVTRDIPDGYIAFGNPARPVRKITEQDSIYLKKDLW